MTALSDDLETYLDAERDIEAPALAQRQRMFERLEPLLLVPVALAAGAAAAASSASAATTTVEATGGAVLGGALKLKIAAAVVSAAVLGGAVGATGHAYFAEPMAPATVAPAPRPLAPPAAEPAVPPALDAPRASAPTPPSAVSAPSPAASPKPAPLPASSLRAERLLIETASAALLRGDPKSAVVALRRHARQFPKGDLAAEREVLLARAFAASGQ
jgi:hypothetical protein